MKTKTKIKISFITLIILFFPIKEKSKEVHLRHTTIESNLRKKLIENKRSWSKSDIVKAVTALYIGEKYHNIDHHIVLSVIQIETDYYIYSINRNKDRIASIDYGPCQINTQSLDDLYNRAEVILIKEKINNFDKSNLYDIQLNILSCYIHLNDYKQELVQKKEYNFMRWIQSYNCGINGSSDKEVYKHLREKKAKYYVKFVQTTIEDKNELTEVVLN